MLPVATSGRCTSARRTLAMKSGPPIAETGNTLMKSAPSSAALIISVGVIVPGMLIASRARAAWIISGTSTALTRKRAPAESACAASRAICGLPVRMTATSRSSPKIRIRSRRKASGRWVMAIDLMVRDPLGRGRCRKCQNSATRPIAVRLFRLRGPLDEKDPRGGPISVQDLDRGADELVLTGFYIPQIETLDDHDVRSQQRLVDGIALL